MTGTIVNVIAVIAGGSIGFYFHKRINTRYTALIFEVLGLFTIFLGIKLAIGTEHYLILISSLILGIISGEMIGIDHAMDRFSKWLQIRMKLGGERFSEGMITSFLMFCMGTMTILGAINEGLKNDPGILYTKSAMDGVSAIVLATGLGYGVIFSSVPLLIYQGSLTLFARLLGNSIPEFIIIEITAAGGIMLIGLGLQILGVKKINILNMLPALVFAAIITYFFGR